MSREEHTDDLRNVREGDTVTLKAEKLTETMAECVERTVSYPPKDSPHIRETTLWHFELSDGREVVASIINGLASNEAQQGMFPKHVDLCESEPDGASYGLIERVTIHGKMEA